MAAQFRIFGVPVRVDPWFLLGLLFIYSWSGGERTGLVAAVALGVLTLVHELGHALVARHYGCEVAISLNLFVGWASYSAPAPLNRQRQIAISLAGPLSQLAVSWIGLVLIHRYLWDGQPHRLDSIAFDLWRGLTWAGTVIAVLNLLPLWPLDGGHVVFRLLTVRFDERRALRIMAMGTLVAIGVLIVVGLVSSQGTTSSFDSLELRRALAFSPIANESVVGSLVDQLLAVPGHLLALPWFLFLFCGLAASQTLRRIGGSTPGPVLPPPGQYLSRHPAVSAAAEAEQTAWERGTIGRFPPGWEASPWLRGHLAWEAGDLDGVRAALSQVVAPGRQWTLPNPGHPMIRRLFDSLTEPLPIGASGPTLTLLMVAGFHASADRMLQFASRLYAATRDPEVLFTAAGALARTGHPDDAMAWLRRGMLERPDAARLAADRAFDPLRARADFARLVAETGA